MTCAEIYPIDDWYSAANEPRRRTTHRIYRRNTDCVSNKSNAEKEKTMDGAKVSRRHCAARPNPEPTEICTLRRAGKFKVRTTRDGTPTTGETTVAASDYLMEMSTHRPSRYNNAYRQDAEKKIARGFKFRHVNVCISRSAFFFAPNSGESAHVTPSIPFCVARR